jgi:hypothetical protein
MGSILVLDAEWQPFFGIFHISGVLKLGRWVGFDPDGAAARTLWRVDSPLEHCSEVILSKIPPGTQPSRVLGVVSLT